MVCVATAAIFVSSCFSGSLWSAMINVREIVKSTKAQLRRGLEKFCGRLLYVWGSMLCVMGCRLWVLGYWSQRARDPCFPKLEPTILHSEVKHWVPATLGPPNGISSWIRHTKEEFDIETTTDKWKPSLGQSRQV